MRLRRLDWLSVLFLLLWLLTLIATPLVNHWGGERALHAMIHLGVLMQAATVFTVLGRGLGWRPALLMVLPILPFAWLVEFIGSQTGIPFGRYHYTGLLQPQVGSVPLVIPLAWLMMLPPAWAVAARVVRHGRGRLSLRFLRALVAALAFTAWDFFLDPQMVTWGFWVWERPGAYFGIPLVNFLGWFLTSFLFAFLFAPASFPRPTANLLFLIYVLTWLLQTIAQLAFWDLAGPALFGFLAMGGMVLWALLRSGYVPNTA